MKTSFTIWVPENYTEEKVFTSLLEDGLDALLDIDEEICSKPFTVSVDISLSRRHKTYKEGITYENAFRLA